MSQSHQRDDVPRDAPFGAGPEDIADLIQGLMGGGGQKAQQPQAAGGPDLSDLIQGLMGGGGAQQARQPQTAGGPDLSDLIQGLMGGGGGQQAQQAQAAGGPDLSDLIQGLMGGGGQGRQAQAPGGLDLLSLIGSLMGGGSATGRSGTTGVPSFLVPIVSGLAQKLGVSPQIATAIAVMALTKLLPAAMSGASSKAQPAPAKSPSKAASGKPGLDLQEIVKGVFGSAPAAARGGRVSFGSAGVPASRPADPQAAALAAELAQQTGLDEATAAQGLQEALLMFGQEFDAAAGSPEVAEKRLNALGMVLGAGPVSAGTPSDTAAAPRASRAAAPRKAPAKRKPVRKGGNRED